jgi:hypothetical protein
MNVYKTIIALTENMKESFTIFYGCYSMPEYKANKSTLNPHFKNGGYKILINILPTVSRLSRLGINSKFLKTGLFIYKMFDYGVDTLQIERRRNSIVFNRKYKFAGDLLTNIWPLNVVREGTAPEAESVWEYAPRSLPPMQPLVPSLQTPRNTLLLPPPLRPLGNSLVRQNMAPIAPGLGMGAPTSEPALSLPPPLRPIGDPSPENMMPRRTTWSSLAPELRQRMPPPAPPLSRTSKQEPEYDYENSKLSSVTPELPIAVNGPPPEQLMPRNTMPSFVNSELPKGPPPPPMYIPSSGPFMSPEQIRGLYAQGGKTKKSKKTKKLSSKKHTYKH